MYALRTERVEPSSLPAAGLRTKVDSANEDYRWLLTLSDAPKKKLQKSEDLRGENSVFYHPPPLLRVPTAPPGPRNKPDFLCNISDIPFSGPPPFSRLTLIQPLVLPASAAMRAGSGELGASTTGTLPRAPTPSRETNPLQPRYRVLSPEPGSPSYRLPYPTAAQEPGEWRITSPVRRGALDVSDISGTRPGQVVRHRKDEYNTLDYTDITYKSTSPVKQRMRDAMREGRPGVARFDPPRLGIWAGALGGDSGAYLKTQRQPVANPNSPQYAIHGQAITDDPGLGQSRQLVAPASADQARRVWRGGSDDPKSIVSHWNSLEAKKTWPGSPTRRYAAAVKTALDRVNSAAAEVAALPWFNNNYRRSH